MSRIQALDEITAQLGAPVFSRWVEAPFGAAAAVVRFRHRGAVVELSASRSFRLIYQLSPSQVVREGAAPARGHHMVPAGSITPSLLERPERIRIMGSADTLHVFFSPEFAAACDCKPVERSLRSRRGLQAVAAQALVWSSSHGTEEQLKHSIASVATLVAAGQERMEPAAGGLTSHARQAMLHLLEQALVNGISVPELAAAAHLSVHHFIKACRHSEGCTPHALLMQKRIERAVELLFTRRASVQEIAVEVGFSSSSHFISTFRRLIGVTPASLRRAAQS